MAANCRTATRTDKLVSSINKEWLRWFYFHEQGDTIPEIMEFAGKARCTIYRGIQRAREWVQRQAELQALSEGEILLQMIGVTGRQCDHSRPMTFAGTALCIDCNRTNNSRRTSWGRISETATEEDLAQAELAKVLTKEELQPTGPAKFKPKGAKTARSGLP